jgi:hypothetical protein
LLEYTDQRDRTPCKGCGRCNPEFSLGKAVIPFPCRA